MSDDPNSFDVPGPPPLENPPTFPAPEPAPDLPTVFFPLTQWPPKNGEFDSLPSAPEIPPAPELPDYGPPPETPSSGGDPDLQQQIDALRMINADLLRRALDARRDLEQLWAQITPPLAMGTTGANGDTVFSAGVDHGSGATVDSPVAEIDFVDVGALPGSPDTGKTRFNVRWTKTGYDNTTHIFGIRGDIDIDTSNSGSNLSASLDGSIFASGVGILNVNSSHEFRADFAFTESPTGRATLEWKGYDVGYSNIDTAATIPGTRALTFVQNAHADAYSPLPADYSEYPVRWTVALEDGSNQNVVASGVVRLPSAANNPLTFTANGDALPGGNGGVGVSTVNILSEHPLAGREDFDFADLGGGEVTVEWNGIDLLDDDTSDNDVAGSDANRAINIVNAHGYNNRKDFSVTHNAANGFIGNLEWNAMMVGVDHNATPTGFGNASLTNAASLDLHDTVRRWALSDTGSLVPSYPSAMYREVNWVERYDASNDTLILRGVIPVGACIVKITSAASGGGKYNGRVCTGNSSAVATGNVALPEGLTVPGSDDALVINMAEDDLSGHIIGASTNTYHPGIVVGATAGGLKIVFVKVGATANNFRVTSNAYDTTNHTLTFTGVTDTYSGGLWIKASSTITTTFETAVTCT